jgi:two-component system alkaline phosphatase synthesis response regulator PhoP
MTKALIIEDDVTFRETITLALETEGINTVAVSDGEEGLKAGLAEKFDVILLDLVLPALSGLEVCRRLREKGVKTPVLMISGEKKEEIDKVLGLEFGADDYILKPFGTKELLARIRAVLRRTKPEPSELEECSFGDIWVNFKKQTASKGGRGISLTAKEYALLKLFVTQEGEVVTREIILDKVWGYEKFPTTRTVDTFVHNLRHKIEDDPAHPKHLLTVPWSGYKFQK